MVSPKLMLWLFGLHDRQRNGWKQVERTACNTPPSPRPAVQGGSSPTHEFENTPDCATQIVHKPTAPSANLSLRAQTLAARQSSRIAIKAKGKIVFTDSAKIIALEADGNRVSLRHTSGTYVIRESISSMALKLDRFGFVRIHRSILVNRVYIEEVRRGGNGAYLVRVSGGKEYTITRTYKENLRLFAESWLGAEI
jgi:DNA-binding LytR/AlgR family response regulator